MKKRNYPRRGRWKVFDTDSGQKIKSIDGSDQRTAGGILRRCIVCGTRSSLRLSHIIPSWAFDWHKTAWGGVVNISQLNNGLKIQLQDSNKHYLLCSSCEQKASIVENYAKSIVNRDRKMLRKYGTTYLFGDRYWRLRFDLIELFVAYVAIRVHYCTSVPWGSRKLPIYLVKRLRRTLLGRPTEKIMTTAWRFTTPKSDPKHDPREDIGVDCEENTLGWCIICMIGGIEWAAFFEPAKAIKIGFVGFGMGITSRIVNLPYTEHRIFKYPEKWTKSPPADWR
ncbi:hypothetical protein FEM03_21090 [Phragmitibacter flavus]|uniref:Uncharacterized protein n=1 Tax=Phragmitibacter flavus TaxID=2576071 RepID=A0A5R8K8L4_9BACT|nr:hypothetical protein [Phragmitibacter flavus]TLD68682.1 hypothetical protein FEM03_21090 [Phragmitibacter flavus]